MGLLKCLHTADERAEDLLLNEDGFPDDLKELVEHVSLGMLEKIVASRLGDLLLPETITRLTSKKTKQIGKVVEVRFGQELAPEPESELKSEPDNIEFYDAYSALRAAKKAVNDVHLRLLTRGEGVQEARAVELIAEALRVIGCAREMGANTDADKIEQKLNRILGEGKRGE